MFKIRKALAVIFCLIFTLMFAFPAIIFFQNEAEFAAGFFGVIKPLIFQSALIGIVISLIVATIPGRAFSMIISLLCILSVLFYIQASFLFSSYGAFNGHNIEWSKFYYAGKVDIAVWTIGILVSLVWYRKIARVSGYITFFLTIVLVLGIGAKAIEAPSRFFTKEISKSRDTLYGLSRDKNVIWLIFDSFVSPTFQSILSAEPKLIEEFSGFTFYKDTVSPFVTTRATIPALLSGVDYDNRITLSEFSDSALGDKSLPALMLANGFDVDTVTLKRFCGYIEGNCFSTNTVVSRDVKEIERTDMLEVYDLSLFRVLPQFLKRRVYNKQQWFLQRIFDTIGNPRSLYNGLRFIDMFEKRAEVRLENPAYKFFHLMIPHVPIIFDKECKPVLRSGDRKKQNQMRRYEGQARCAVSLALRFIDKLKRIGAFDNSLVIISGDHGFPLRYLKYRTRKDKPLPWIEHAWPLLLIKPFGKIDESKGLVTSHVPASLMDIAKTIMDDVDIDANISGESLFKIPEFSIRERSHRSYTWEIEYRSKDYLPNMREWRIKGPVYEPASWEFVQKLVYDKSPK